MAFLPNKRDDLCFIEQMQKQELVEDNTMLRQQVIHANVQLRRLETMLNQKQRETDLLSSYVTQLTTQVVEVRSEVHRMQRITSDLVAAVDAKKSTAAWDQVFRFDDFPSEATVVTATSAPPSPLQLPASLLEQF